ncbi:hypothetical protein [Micromonospora chersina]|uniref:hypothetical protein n=1 Tax=Micromonospora chersina TaxID=47854 RepID=UPI0033B78A94
MSQRRFRSGLFAVGATLSILAVQASPANAVAGGGAGTFGKDCTLPLCGIATNDHGSERKLVISDNWPAEQGTKKVLAAGETSRKHFKDTDAFWVPTGCKAMAFRGGTYGPGWQRIRDNQHLTLRIDC